LCPLASPQAERTAAVLPDCELVVRPGERHLGDFAAADEIQPLYVRVPDAEEMRT